MEVGFVEGFVGDGCTEEGKRDGGTFGSVWSLWWNKWRWRRKKMMTSVVDVVVVVIVVEMNEEWG